MMVPSPSRKLLNPSWPVLPIAPYSQRKTLVTEVVPSEVWAFDQLQGIVYVHVPVRMIVVKVEEGLLAYAPNAPTAECLEELRKLEAAHGEVKHVVLPTLGIEHKAFFGQFCLNFPEAQVWYTPGQYSFPVNFPDLNFLGLAKRAKELPRRGELLPGIEVSTLGPIVPPGNGGFGETTLYHRKTRTLLVVDVVLKVPRKPPPIVTYDPRCTLFHARDDVADVVSQDDKTIAKGWRRLALFAFFFQPAALDVVPVPECVFQARRSCGMKNQFGWFDLFPFEWNAKQADKSFETIARPKLFVAPILQELILNRKPNDVLDWLDDVVDRFNFVRIVPCHLAPSIAASPNDLKSAFAFLFRGTSGGSQFEEDDLQALRDFEVGLIKDGAIFPRPTAKPDPPSLRKQRRKEEKKKLQRRKEEKKKLQRRKAEEEDDSPLGSSSSGRRRRKKKGGWPARLFSSFIVPRRR